MLCESFNMQKCLQDTSGGWGQAHHTQISVGLSAGTFSWKQNETARADAGPGQKLSKDPKPTPLTRLPGFSPHGVYDYFKGPRETGCSLAPPEWSGFAP